MKTLLIIDAKHIWKLLIIRMMPNWQLFWAIRFLPTVR